MPTKFTPQLALLHQGNREYVVILTTLSYLDALITDGFVLMDSVPLEDDGDLIGFPTNRLLIQE